MKQNLKNIPDFDDLLFESRNKDYGAYQLRKQYNSVLNMGTLLASLLVIAAVGLPFLSRPRNEHIITGGNFGVQVSMQNLESPPEEKVYVSSSPPPSEALKMPETVKYVPPVVVDTIIPIERATITTDEALALQDNELIDYTLSAFGDGLLLEGDGTGTAEPLFIVEVMPSFRGGDLTKFHDWVQKRTNYPQEAIDNKIKGTVILTFIVEKDGSVSNVSIVKGVHPLLDTEAVKAISESPKWSPGLQRGQPVRVRFLIPLIFT